MRLFGGVRLVDGPSVRNIRLLDAGAMPWIESASYYGIQVDPPHFVKLSKELGDEMESLTDEVQKVTGVYTNLDSPQQVSDLLFKGLGLKQARRKMTQSGAREAADNEVLEGIKHDHPIIPLILEYKECSKLRGTYCGPIVKLARKAPDGTWRLYPNFKYTRVPSGRFSCDEPNLLAIPAHSKRAKRLREGFITRDGWVLITVDFSQIEPRIAAHRSNCKALIQVYENDEDLYSDFAITAFKLKDDRYQDDTGKWKYPHVDKEDHRFPSKTAVLACLYRVTAPGLLAQMPVGKGWTENRCQDLLINPFYIKYHELIQMGKRDDARARNKEMVWDMFGRILHTPGVKSVLPWVVSATLRELANHPIQGSACGAFKLAMASTHQIWEQARLEDVIHPLLPIHDELLYEVREDLAEEWISVVGGEMGRCIPLLVPIKTSGAQGRTWAEVEK